MTDLQKMVELLDTFMGQESIEGGYSGRGMMGSRCMAFEYRTEKAACLDMIDAMNTDDQEARHLLRTAFGGYLTDSFGMGIVVYFPRLKIDA